MIDTFVKQGGKKRVCEALMVTSGFVGQVRRCVTLSRDRSSLPHLKDDLRDIALGVPFNNTHMATGFFKTIANAQRP